MPSNRFQSERRSGSNAVRRALRFSGLFAALASAAAPPLEAGTHARRPNIIFIMADDLGYGDLGSYGQERIETPNLDRMASEGMRFTDFHTGTPVCAPARSNLMTAMHNGHGRIRGNAKDNLLPEDITVAEVLKAAGYTNGLTGKWGLGHEGSTGIPTRQGFDFFYGYLDQSHAHNYYPTFLLRNEKREPLRNVVPDEGPYGQGMATEKVDYSHDLIMKEALAFVDRSKDKPFFLYLPVTIPHVNNEARLEGLEVPDLGIYKDRNWPAQQKGLAAMITYLDKDIGRLMDRLKAHGIDSNTIVFFTSDNGPSQESGLNAEFFDSNGPLRGIKRDVFEGGIRVPLIVRWPGKVKAGALNGYTGYFPDVMPTLADLAGISSPQGIDGTSFLSTLMGRDSLQKQHPHLYWEFKEGAIDVKAVRMGKWKAVFTGSGQRMLFDLENDLGEGRNLAAANPALLKRMEDIAEAEHSSSVKVATWTPVVSTPHGNRARLHRNPFAKGFQVGGASGKGTREVFTGHGRRVMSPGAGGIYIQEHDPE